MRRYAIRRTLTVIPVLLGVSILVFGFVHLIPGDPAVTMLGERATPEKVAEVRARLGLDRPIHEQYLLYLGKVLRGDLGVSIVRGDPVLTDLLRRFPATVELAVAAIVLAVLVGIPIGIVSAVWRKSLIDSLSRVLALTGVSMPIFWLGVMLAWVFAVELRLAADRRPARQRGRLRAADPLRHAGRGSPAQLGDDPGRAPPSRPAGRRAGHDPPGGDRADDAGEHARGPLARLHPHGGRQGPLARRSWSCATGCATRSCRC